MINFFYHYHFHAYFFDVFFTNDKFLPLLCFMRGVFFNFLCIFFQSCIYFLVGGDPNTPSSSLDLIQSDVVETIVRLAQPAEITTTAPPKRGRGRPK